MTTLKLPKPVLKALEALGILEDELLGLVNEAAAKDPAFAEGGAAILTFLRERLEPQLGVEAGEALAARIVQQIVSGKLGHDPDHGMDA